MVVLKPLETVARAGQVEAAGLSGLQPLRTPHTQMWQRSGPLPQHGPRFLLVCPIERTLRRYQSWCQSSHPVDKPWQVLSSYGQPMWVMLQMLPAMLGKRSPKGSYRRERKISSLPKATPLACSGQQFHGKTRLWRPSILQPLQPRCDVSLVTKLAFVCKPVG